MTGINESRALTKHICLILEIVIWIKTGITISVRVSVKIQKNISGKKVIFAILQNIAAEMVNMRKYSIGNSVVICDGIIEEIKTIPAKNTSIKFYILLAFLSITIALLIAISIYLKNIY